MRILKAQKSDLSAIQDLTRYAGKSIVTEQDLNGRDIAIQARDTDTGACIGFIWCGLMSQNTVGYLDKFMVDPAYAGKGVGYALASAVASEILRRKVKKVFAIVKKDQWHDNSAMSGLKFGLGADLTPYTYVYADVAHALEQLKGLEHGR